MSKKLLDLDGLRYFYGKILARMGNLSNPALNENPDFQIWQRGTSFQDFQPAVAKYTADRWTLNSGGSNYKVEKTIKGIKITKITEAPTAFAYIIQPLENPPSIGEKVTLTAKVVSGVLGKVRLGVGYGVPSGLTLWESKTLDTVGKNSITVPVQQNNFVVAINIINLGLNEFIELEYVKLELGEIATPFSPRSYGEELALCQRYFRQVELTLRPSYWYTDKPMFIHFFNTSMRVAPSVSLKVQSVYLNRVLQTVTRNDFFGTPDQIKIYPIINSYQDYKDYVLEGSYSLDAEIY